MQRPRSQTNAQWEWKSNPNPYSQYEQAQWTPYKPHDNYLLEKAYFNRQEEVDLGDYIVSIDDMLQKKKGDVYRQRPIRRNTEHVKNEEEEKINEEEENIRTKRFFGAETPKTFNKTFGSLEDYLGFFQNRGPDIKEFAKLFTDIEATNNVDLLNDIVRPGLIQCLKSEAKKMKITTDSQRQYEMELLLLFYENFPSIKQLYARVLKAYTMEGFVYRNLNLYLRNEEWNKLDSLLPYAYCLCKAFLRKEFTSSLKGASMVVYRGGQFDEASLSFYDPKTVKHFCWNGVTSTSRIRHVAEDFMYYHFDLKKVPVLFIIEVPMNFEKNNKWIDVKPYSAIPNEDEIVLPPGSVFELIKVSRNGQKCVEIYLKLMLDVKQLAQQGQIMHGALYSEMASDTSLKLVCLEGREISDAIDYLEGNRLIEELEFCLCKFNEKFVDIPPLEKISNLKSLSFISSFGGNETHWSMMMKHLRNMRIEELKIFDSNFNNNLLHILSEDEGLKHLSFQGLQRLISLKSLTLNFQQCDKITDEGLSYLSSQGLKYLTSLKSLALDFEFCTKITDRGLSYLSLQGLRHLNKLTSLTLNFSYCSQITPEGLNSLGLKYSTSLTKSTLCFDGCSEIPNEKKGSIKQENLQKVRCRSFVRKLKNKNAYFQDTGVSTSINTVVLKVNDDFDKFAENSLKTCQSLRMEIEEISIIKAISYLRKESFPNAPPIKYLSLDVSWVSEEGLKILSSLGLKYLTSLTSLTLDFQICSQITDQGLDYLSSQGLKYLTSLTSLTLDFQRCPEITDEGLYHLSSQGLRNLNSLKSLTLDLQGCHLITEEGLENLSYQGLRYLTSLTALNLNFKNLKEMGEEGWIYLTSHGLKHLTFLTSLTLDFGCCYKITDKVLNHLTEVLKNLISLTSLTLDFQGCYQITDKGLNYLSSQGLRNLTSLISLVLNFRHLSNIRDEGLNSLSSQGLKYLTSLTSLNLNFESCQAVTDEGLNHLSSQGLKHLTSLRFLTLNFEECKEIHPDAWRNFCKVLKYFGYEISYGVKNPSIH